MKQRRFNVEQIVAVLKQAEAGVPLVELIRRVGISEQTFYRWKKQYVGLEVDQVRELKQLQEPYRTTVILRDIEELSYVQIAEVMDVSLGTVKSRLVRGRDALRKRLERFVREIEPELGVESRERNGAKGRRASTAIKSGNQEIEVTP